MVVFESCYFHGVSVSLDLDRNTPNIPLPISLRDSHLRGNVTILRIRMAICIDTRLGVLSSVIVFVSMVAVFELGL